LFAGPFLHFVTLLNQKLAKHTEWIWRPGALGYQIPSELQKKVLIFYFLSSLEARLEQ
jgi:hypothetical protein